jgi:Ser/Thr protein kinase RdoA (MazF antagonist)
VSPAPSGPTGREWVAPPQATAAELITREVALVRRTLRLPESGTVRLVDEGWDSRVYVVDDGAAFFKFPRSPEIRDRYASEIAVLRALEAVELPVWTPVVSWVGRDLEYFGYEGMRGTAPFLADLDPATRARVGEAIGGFARTLHALALPELRRVTLDDEIRSVRAKAEAAVPILDRHLTGELRARVDALFGAVLPEELRRLGEDPRPCHGDLGPWNVILAGDGRIGVIDFGDVAHVDRSKDLCGLDDAIALDAALAVYGAAPGLRDKVAARATAVLLMDVLFFAGKQDHAGLAVGLERVRAAATSWPSRP